MKIGIDIGGSHIAIGVIDNAGAILEKVEKRWTTEEKNQIKQAIEQYICDTVTIFKNNYEIESIGIAIPGTKVEGIIIKTANLNLFNYPIVKILKSKLNLPIYIHNDAKCAAMAEDKYGSTKEYQRSAFLTLGTGIGGAIVIQHKLLDTGAFPGCELGHMVIEKDGIHCNCGRKGCFERYASMKAFKTKLRSRLGLDESTRGQTLFELIRDNQVGDVHYETIVQTVNEFIDDICIGLINIINIFEPEVIGLGGSFVHFESVFLDKIKRKLSTENIVYNQNAKEIEIKVAKLGNDAGMIGATLLVE